VYEEKDYGGYPMAGNELFEEEVLAIPSLAPAVGKATWRDIFW
jgi:hypothetical protein